MPSMDDLRAAIASAPMAAALIAVNLAVFIAVNVDSRLLDVVTLPPDWAGVLAQPWTLVTVFFTAEVFIHIAGAVLIIGLFGSRFERFAGSAHLLGVYVLAGLAGSLALVVTAVATGFDEPSRGASAAFLGLVAAVAACPREARGARLQHLDKVVAAVALVQLAPLVGIGHWVSSAAHLAGMGVGAVYGYRVRTTIEGRNSNAGGQVAAP